MCYMTHCYLVKLLPASAGDINLDHFPFHDLSTSRSSRCPRLIPTHFLFHSRLRRHRARITIHLTHSHSLMELLIHNFNWAQFKFKNSSLLQFIILHSLDITTNFYHPWSPFPHRLI